VVGDETSGSLAHFDGSYYLPLLLVTSPLFMALPLPGDGVAPLNVVPVDFVVKAMWALSQNPKAVGRTFHLVDPNPMSVRRVYLRVAQKVDKRLPRFTLPAKAANVVLRLPGLDRLARPQRAAMAYVNQLAIYNCQNTLELLAGTGIQCPPLESYLDGLMGFVQDYHRKRHDEVASLVEDPLDSPAPA
jgi:hypothetical protein